MKAYIGVDDTVRLFRPELNMDRMRRSMQRLALPVSAARAKVFLARPDACLGARRTLIRTNG